MLNVLRELKSSSASSFYWLAAFLFLLFPSIYVIYLLDSFIKTEQNAQKNEIRQSFTGTLHSNTVNLSNHWINLEKSTLLQNSLPGNILTQTGADSVIIHDKKGKMTFPVTFDEKASLSFLFSNELQNIIIRSKEQPAAQTAKEYLELSRVTEKPTEVAIALIEAARAYEEAGQKVNALEICSKLMFIDKFKNVRDTKNNLILLEAKFIFLKLEPKRSHKFTEVLADLVFMLSSYDAPQITTEQRLNLSQKITSTFPDIFLPLSKAEKIALDLIKHTPNPDRRNILLKTKLKNYWQYTVNGRVTLIYSEDTLQEQLLSTLELAEIPDKTIISLVPPDEKNTDSIVSTEAAYRMPGWRLSLNFIDPLHLKGLIDERVKIYRMTSSLIIGFSLLMGLILLRDMKKKVQLADLKNNLVANVTHELKTPLASSRILLDTLLLHENIPKQKLQDYIRHLSTENNRLCNLVEHFLAFSKLDKNQYTFQIKTTSLDELIDYLEEAINGRFVKERRRIDIECIEENVFLNADIQALVTVLLNLIENALKFSDETEKVKLNIEKRDLNKLSFTVSDKGIGIPPKQLNQIFLRFFQTDSRLSKEQGGCGLGLSIVKTVLDAHQTKVAVSSKLNKGSQFSFQLPIIKEAL
ncbi:MAG: HAMP domain-containing histidine kinase [Lentisphaerales bacterium]|nr:HAMP domain-containing histidine kinase [Lentisphaerales bacterium]